MRVSRHRRRRFRAAYNAPDEDSGSDEWAAAEGRDGDDAAGPFLPLDLPQPDSVQQGEAQPRQRAGWGWL